MDIEKVDIEKLMPDPANVRTHSEKNMKAIQASLARFGQQKPIVVNSKNVIIAGNGTYTAALQLGWEDIACVYTELDSVDAIAYAIADNRTTELSDWDYSGLASLVAELQDSEFDISVLGFDEAELSNFLNTDWEAPAKEALDPNLDDSVRVSFSKEEWEILEPRVARFKETGGKGLSDSLCIVHLTELYFDDN